MNDDNLLEILGTVHHIVYTNPQNGYTVAKVQSGDALLTVAGTMPELLPGEEVRLTGKHKNHASFGEQFIVFAYEKAKPKQATQILRYLSSGAVKGVGPATAKKLVEMFGDETLNVMENSPEKMVLVKGITRAKAQKIAEEVASSASLQELALFLGEYGIAMDCAVRVFRELGSSAVEQLCRDPYIICQSPMNAQFSQADMLATGLKLEKTSACRITTGLLHSLGQAATNGHTCLVHENLTEITAKFLKIEEEKVEQRLEELLNEGALQRFCTENEYIFLPKMYHSELFIADRLLILQKFPPQKILEVDELISRAEQDGEIVYAEMQKTAIRSAAEEGLLVLTGGPGTGKTTTLNAIIQVLKKRGQRVFLAAPTGRAAQRLSAVTGHVAKTVHRLLEGTLGENDETIFKRNETNLLQCDALILDEVSMMDVQLFEAVLHALPFGCRLILVGDSHQLPPVGAGNVLADLIASEKLPVVRLTEIFRQAKSSLIVTNAHRIVNGEGPELSRRDSNFFFLELSDAQKISETIVDLCARRLPKSYGFSSLFDIQVICPSKKGPLGTLALNAKLQAALNPPSSSKSEFAMGGKLLREGDKVMQIRNNYDATFEKTDGTGGSGIFNGDMGTLERISANEGALTVRFDEKLAKYDREMVQDLDLAYAITVHKSQGSEFGAVVMPMFPGAPQLECRNLLYTAVTRAKSLLVMVGRCSVVQRMVASNRVNMRFSGLANFLRRKI